MNELALFAGVGGGILGSHLAGCRVVCAVEKEPYCREVLLRRQRDGVLPMFPIWDDVKTFDGREWRGAVDLVTAGFPCQPFSVAGERRGEDDERNLWPETVRIIREVRPRLCLLENVPGLLGSHGYFGRILGDLAESGLDVVWDCVPASAVGANHQRDRLWLVAYPSSERIHEQPRRRTGESRPGPILPDRNGADGDVADSDLGRCEVERESKHATEQSPFRCIADRCSEGRRWQRESVADPKGKRQQGTRTATKQCGSAVGFDGEAIPNTEDSIEKLRREGPQGVDWWSSEPDVGRVAHELADGVDVSRTTTKGEIR